MQAVILAAGRGTRLVPFTLSRSKAMAPIVGKPMVERVLETVIEAGVREVIVVISEKDTEIHSHFQTYKNCRILFAIQKERLGMAHALNCAKKYITSDFLLSSSDSLISTEFVKQLIDAYKKSGSKACIALMKVPPERISKTGIVSFTKDNRIAKIVEKPLPQDAPSHIGSLPIYAFSKDILTYLDNVPLSSRGEYELQDAVNMLIKDHGAIEGLHAPFRYDLTRPDDLLQINLMFLKQMSHSKILSKIHSSVKIVDPVHIGKKVTIGTDCIIGPYAYIESDVVIEKNCVINNSVLLKGTRISEGSRVNEKILL